MDPSKHILVCRSTINNPKTDLSIRNPPPTPSHENMKKKYKWSHYFFLNYINYLYNFFFQKHLSTRETVCSWRWKLLQSLQANGGVQGHWYWPSPCDRGRSIIIFRTCPLQQNSGVFSILTSIFLFPPNSKQQGVVLLKVACEFEYFSIEFPNKMFHYVISFYLLIKKWSYQ